MQLEQNNATEGGGVDLISKLKQATETKIPNLKAAVKAWDFKDDEESEADLAPKNTDTEKTQVKNDTENKTNPGEVKKLSKQELEASAESGATITEFVTSTLFEGIARIRNKKKFTIDEWDKLEDRLIDEELSNLTGEDLKLRKKYDRLQNALEKKLEALETTDKQRKKMYDAFYKYSEITGKGLGPGWIIGATIIDVVIDKGIEAFTD